MAHRPRGRVVLQTLFAAALGLLVAVPVAGAVAPQSASLSSEFRAYQAELARGVVSPASAHGHGLGLMPEPMDPPKASAAAGPARLKVETLPATYDLRTLGRLTAVRDQGAFGTCWSFATYASLESIMMPYAPHDFSEDNMVLTAGFDNGGDPYNAGGNYYMATAYLARWGGPVDETADAYGDGVTPAGLSPAKHVQEVLYIAGGADRTDTSRIKQAIMTYGAVGTSVSWNDAAYSSAENSFYYGGADDTNHAVAIVGWDDTFAASRFASTPAGDGAWLVRNSWGTTWGDGGYFWVSYDDAYCGRDTVFNAVYKGVESASNYTSVYYHDPLGQVDTVGYGEETAWGANVFSAQSSQMINAVGFFTHVPNTTYAVYAGGVTADGAPGSLGLKASGTFNTAGYHTVKFSSPRWVTAGSKFTVAIQLTTPGFGYPIAYEAPLVGFSSNATAAPDQSFVRYDADEGWFDLTDWDASANVCLKAYGKKDNVKPSTSTSAARVRRYSTATLKFKVSDPAPSSGAATCSVQIIKSGKVVKSIYIGSKSTNVGASYRWKATLRRGTYYWRVAAKDRAGNTATTRLQSKLVIY